MSCEKHKAGLAVDCIELEQTPIEKAIWSVLDEYRDAEKHSLKEWDFVCDVLQKVEEAVSKCTFTGWIPCSERLPEDESIMYWTTHEDGSVVMHGFTKKNGFIFNWEVDDLEKRKRQCDVIAWKPILLPEPYKVGDQE